MSKSKENYRLLIGKLLADKPVAFHADLGRCFGGIRNGILLSQFLFWSANTSAEERKGWFWKSVKECEQETSLTRKEQETARGQLTKAGILEHQCRGIPCTTWYRVKMDAVVKALDEFYRTGEPLIIRERTRKDKQRNAAGEWQKETSQFASDTQGSLPVTRELFLEYAHRKSGQRISPGRGTRLSAKTALRTCTLAQEQEKSLLVSVAFAIAEACCLDIKIASIKGRVFRRAKELLCASIPPTPERIREIYGPGGWWYRNDWRGVRGDAPTPENILETWGVLTGGARVRQGNDPAAVEADPNRYIKGIYADFVLH